MKYLILFENFNSDNSDNSDIVEKDITVYRGEGKDIGNTTYVSGKCYADSTQFASKYGDIIFTNIIKKGSKIFDFEDVNGKPNQKIIPQEVLVNPDKTREFLIKKGYDVTKNKNVTGVEYVILNNSCVEKDQYYFQKGWNDNYDPMEGEPAWTFYDENNKELYFILTPEDNSDYEHDEYGSSDGNFSLFDIEKGEIMKEFETDKDALIWFNKFVIPNSLPEELR